MFRFVKQISGSQDPLICFFLCARRAHVLTGESPQTALFSGKVTAKVKGGPVKGAWRKMEANP